MSVYDQDKAAVRRVFISYSSIDRIRTNGLGLLLEAMGHQVFHDHRTIKPGMKWEAALQDGLDDADGLMVFWTKNAARSDWVRKEYEYFLTTYPDRMLVPVTGDETPLPDTLKARQAADFAPIVNEVLDLKRNMKKQGASGSEIEQAVIHRLDDAGIEIKSKKQRKLLGLFLGFNPLWLLLRHPAESAKKAGRSAVEKTAQVTAGQALAIAAAAVVGLAAGKPVVDAAMNAMSSRGDSDITMDESSMNAANMTTNVPRDTMTLGSGEPASGDDVMIGTANYGEGLIERHDTTHVRLEEILGRLDALEVGEADALIACRQENTELRGELAQVQAQLAAPRPEPDVTGEEDIVVPEPQGTAPEQQHQIYFVPVDFDESEIVDPVPLDAPHPEYPRLAVDQGIEGTVTVRATIHETGEVTVYEADGPSVLREAASDAVNKWFFRAGTRNGRPIEREFDVTITFAFTRGR